MSFGKDIYTLLLQHDVVIIPGLGAFVSEYQPAEINDENDEIKPPSKSISFNPLLKNNDGLLVGHIAEKLRISHLKALARVEKERDEMLFNLDKGDEVFIEGVGTLSYDDHGVIAFKASGEENMLLDSFGLESMSINEPEQPEVTPVAEGGSEADSLAKAPEQAKEEFKADETADEKPEPKGTIPEANAGKEKEKKKKPWLFLLIIIPLIVVSFFIFLKGFNDGKKDNVKVKEMQIAEESIVEQDTIAIDTSINDSMPISSIDTTVFSDSTKAMYEPAKILTTEQDSVRYYLVVGSFSVKENADNYLLELQEKGYNAFHVGKKGRFFIIGIDSYKTFSEAEAAKEEYLLNNPKSEVWVYRN